MQTVPERHSNSGHLGFDESSRRYQALLHTADLAAQADANSCVCAGSAAWEKAMPFDLWRCIRRRPESGSRATKASRPDPLYLSHCGLNWSRFGDTSSGWELLQAMRSKDRGARALAAEFLAETENGRLLVRD